MEVEKGNWHAKGHVKVAGLKVRGARRKEDNGGARETTVIVQRGKKLWGGMIGVREEG